MLAEIVRANGKCHCRGGSEECHFKYPRHITKGSKALRIGIHAAGGGAVAFYCTECMKPILKNLEEVLSQMKEDNS